MHTQFLVASRTRSPFPVKKRSQTSGAAVSARADAPPSIMRRPEVAHGLTARELMGLFAEQDPGHASEASHVSPGPRR